MRGVGECQRHIKGVHRPLASVSGDQAGGETGDPAGGENQKPPNSHKHQKPIQGQNK